MMLPAQEKIRHLFKKNRVVDMQLLSAQLNNRSTRSIFRDLEREGYFSSFSHSGKYYTLKNIPDFNSEGIWFYQHIGFTRYGTLKDTLIHLVKNSSAGKTHDELKQQLRIRVQNTLLDLVRANKLIRKKIVDNYVYFSDNTTSSSKQILQRERSYTVSEMTDYSDRIIIEVLASIIRTTRTEDIEPSKIISDLASRKIAMTESQIEHVLTQLHLKKTLG